MRAICYCLETFESNNSTHLFSMCLPPIPVWSARHFQLTKNVSINYQKVTIWANTLVSDCLHPKRPHGVLKLYVMKCLGLNNKLDKIDADRMFFNSLSKRKSSLNDLDIGTCPNCLSFKGKIRLFWPFCCWQSHLLGPIWRDLHSATYVASAKPAEYRPYLYFKSK